MNVFTDPNQLPEFKNSVITIGSFDGVHQGHRKIISKINHIAKRINGESVVITFHPHPRQVVDPTDVPFPILSTVLEKIHLLSQTGVDNLVIVPFTVEMSQMHPDEYIENFLVKKFKPKYIVIGYDHRFGLNRQGNIDYLRWFSKKHNYQVVEIPKTEVEQIGVSSTKIRTAVLSHDMLTATKYLGHPYLISGKVISGNKIGQSIDFPTANIEIEDRNKLVLPYGIYSAYATYDGEKYKGMLYVGDRPIMKDDNSRTVEINLFDFSESIYGAILALEVIEFIRPDKEIETLDELRTQLFIDKESVLESLERFEKEKVSSGSLITSVSVVILNFNGLQHLQTFLAGVIEHTPNVQIYVADNNSTDKSISWLNENHPEVVVINLQKNYGFAEGYNKALEQLDDEYFVLLNSDVEVSEGWLDEMLKLASSDPVIAAVQPKILSYERKDEFEYAGASGGFIDALHYPFCRGRIFDFVEKDEGQYNDVREIFWASGACMLVKAELFNELGGFDKDYFAHFEEIDLAWRIHKCGYKIMVAPASVVYHLGGGTLNYESTHKTYLNYRNNLYTIAKNEYLLNLIWVIPTRLVTDALSLFYMILIGKPEHSLYILQAYLVFILNIPNLFYKRIRDNEKIDLVKLPDAPNNRGIFRGFILWQYFALGRKTFKKI